MVFHCTNIPIPHWHLPRRSQWAQWSPKAPPPPQQVRPKVRVAPREAERGILQWWYFPWKLHRIFHDFRLIFQCGRLLGFPVPPVFWKLHGIFDIFWYSMIFQYSQLLGFHFWSFRGNLQVEKWDLQAKMLALWLRGHSSTCGTIPLFYEGHWSHPQTGTKPYRAAVLRSSYFLTRTLC